MESKIIVRAKNVIIGFFVLVFVMGFFSKSIINLFLPKVIAEPALEGVIERSKTVQGIVRAKKNFSVRLADQVIVEEYFVENGAAVQVGAPLFRIDKEYSFKDSSADIERLRLQIDARKRRIESLNGASYQIEHKSIAAMESKLDNSNEEFKKQETLYEAGIISSQELDVFRKGIDQQELSIELAKLQLEEKEKQAAAAIKDEENELKGIQLQIQDIESQIGLQSKIDKDGIFYSEVSGIVTSINATQNILPRDSVLIEIADNSEEQELIFAGIISEEDYEFVKTERDIQILGANGKIIKQAHITSISRQINQDTYIVEGAFMKLQQEDLKIGQKLKGVIKRQYEMEGKLNIPKSAVIVFGEYEEGAPGIVYLLEEANGILGKEFKAKEVAIKLLAIGDDEVIVSGLEGFQQSRVIVNLSYKIRDGVKVFLWQ